jgi:hypothetical protein
MTCCYATKLRGGLRSLHEEDEEVTGERQSVILTERYNLCRTVSQVLTKEPVGFCSPAPPTGEKTTFGFAYGISLSSLGLSPV